MRTIFITSFHPLISRNILMSGVHQDLAKENRVVLLVPQEKAPYFEEEYGGENIIVEGVDTTLARRDVLLRSWILAVTHTAGLTIKKRAKYFADRRLLSFLISYLPSAVFRGARPVVAFLRFLDPLILRSRRFAPYLERYQPALVFLTDLQNEMDVRLLEESKRRGIRTVGMMRSWDNVSSKGLLRALPSRIVVHNEFLKQEVVVQNHVRSFRVEVVGIPHYDRYFDPEPSSREAFFSSMGLDPLRKLVLLAPIGDRYIRNNKLDASILETLAQLDANILVRLPPTDTVAYLPIPQKKARIVVQKTGDRPWKGNRGAGASKLNEVTRRDEQTLIDSLYFADIVVTGQSTIAVDAAAFNTPIIIANFDQEPREYFDSMRRYYDYEYYVPVLESGGVFVARSKEELVQLAARSLGDKTLGAQGRTRLIGYQAWKRGGATARLVSFVRSQLP